MKHCLTIDNEQGDQIAVTLVPEGSREVGKLIIDGVPYHVERMKSATMNRRYVVDADEDYRPQHDSAGKCVIVAPYSMR
jgi:hypothetical protein